MNNTIPAEKKARAVALRKQGLPHACIRERLGLSQSSLTAILSEAKASAGSADLSKERVA